MGRGKEKRSDKVACNLCNRRFKTDNDLQAHVQNKHLQDPRAVESLSNHLGTRLQIVLEDDWIAVVVNPQGCPTFGKGSFAKSWLLAQLVPSQASDALSKARPAHRLDAPTGGLMVLAKSKSSMRQLSEAFAQGLVKKRYRALVRGNYALGSSGECKEPLYGKPCTTRFQAMEEPVETQEGPVSTLDLWPQHGRRHQRRRHMAMLGSPIVGDRRYGGAQSEDAEAEPEDADDAEEAGDVGVLYLWALEISFPHPDQRVDEEGTIRTELPEPAMFADFRRTCGRPVVEAACEKL